VPKVTHTTAVKKHAYNEAFMQFHVPILFCWDLQFLGGHHSEIVKW